MYEKLLDLNNLYSAFQNCKKGINWKESVQRYESNLLCNILQLKSRLENQTYKQKPFYEFDIFERGKPRHIKSIHISDRVLQRALCDYVLNPVLYRYLIYDNGASVKGKGIDFARKRLKQHLVKYYHKYGKNGYVLLIDFSKYFDNIPHDILIKKLKEKIQDEKVINLLIYLISLQQGNKGVGIGSQLSQTIGIFYPTELDQFCKTVKSCKYYGRYMDDTYIIHYDKEFLKNLLNEYIKKAEELGIIINKKKTQIINLKNGFKYLQMRYRITCSGKILVIPVRKSINRERRKLKKFLGKLNKGLITKEQIKEQYLSWRGNIKKYNCYKSLRTTDNLYRKMYGDFINERSNSIKQIRYKKDIGRMVPCRRKRCITF